jgi:hypothetical protein
MTVALEVPAIATTRCPECHAVCKAPVQVNPWQWEPSEVAAGCVHGTDICRHCGHETATQTIRWKPVAVPAV